MKKFKPFQIRWKEALGKPECPYLYRWTFIFFNFSIRLHHWIRSDDKRHFHDHPMDFISILLKGHYTNVNPAPDGEGEVRHEISAPGIWWGKGSEKHYLDIPEGGAWTLLICGRPYRKWGFYVKGKLWRPLRYFSKFGTPPCDFQ